MTTRHGSAGNPPQGPGTRVPGGGAGGCVPSIDLNDRHRAAIDANFRRRECLDMRGAVHLGLQGSGLRKRRLRGR